MGVKRHVITDGTVGVCDKCVMVSMMAGVQVHDILHSIVCQLEENCVKKMSSLSLDANSSLVVFRLLAKQTWQWRIVQQGRRVEIA